MSRTRARAGAKASGCGKCECSFICYNMVYAMDLTHPEDKPYIFIVVVVVVVVGGDSSFLEFHIWFFQIRYPSNAFILYKIKSYEALRQRLTI